MHTVKCAVFELRWSSLLLVGPPAAAVTNRVCQVYQEPAWPMVDGMTSSCQARGSCRYG